MNISKEALKTSLSRGAKLFITVLIAATAGPQILVANLASADDGGYPWIGATTVNQATYDWGYTTCPSNSPNCMLLTGTLNGTTYGEADPWVYYFRNCTSYVAWKVGQNGFNVHGWGNAANWANNAPSGTVKDPSTYTPAVGDIAQWGTEKGGGFGHVSYVYAVSNGIASLDEYNVAGTGNFTGENTSPRTTASTSAGTPDHYIHIGTVTNWATPAVASTENSTGGDFNGDGYDDTAIVHQIADGGADVHIFYGSSGTPFQNTTTFTRRLSGADGWDWTKMKLAVGHFNGDKYSDLAILHQQSDGGIGVHILYGGSTPFQNTTTAVRWLTGSAGWDWTKIRVVSGDFNGDGYDDIAIVHQIADGGADIHILYGSAGTPFQNSTTFTRRLSGTDGWNWTQMKLAAGMFNGGPCADLAILHQIADGGADVQVLYGATTTPFQNTTTFVRRLAGSDGWNWTQMKLAAGAFNGGTYADVAIIHQIADGGADLHVLYGVTSGTPFQYATTFARRLPGSAGWVWSEMKFANGLFNSSAYADLTIIHQIADGGADLQLLYGGVGGTPFQNTTTWVRRLSGADGWNWTQMKITY